VELDGTALARRVADALVDAGAARVIAVGGDAPALGRLGLDVVPDQHPGEGPLGGVLSALDALPGFALVAVLACDLLRPSPATIRSLADHARGADADVAVPAVDGRPQFHHAVWRPRAAPVLRAAFDAGERALRRAASSLQVAVVEGLDPATLEDVDDPAALDEARRRSAGQQRPPGG
ncbi:MAG TPA: molybdenum cofactor guanylyltransferase, partial [Acidimicrobiales bacterium]